MAKSLRSKRKKRLRTLRREMVEPYYDKKDVAKYAALEAALAAPKVPVFAKGKNGEVTVMDDDDSMFKSIPAAVDVATEAMETDVEERSFLKPTGGVEKKKRNWKGGKKIRHKRFKRKGNNNITF
ncbi:hypothetical protein ZOSMA_85G00350 [Zostera marina]|uniref:Uncharacterized protein n=1 Tax=Zostera marina TaxID=29655 RepID=A0A0K9NNA8_ZOSMR|nr:hypothetical protein ZOSMA_85G00350 [Zostera marina]